MCFWKQDVYCSGFMTSIQYELVCEEGSAGSYTTRLLATMLAKVDRKIAAASETPERQT